MDVRYTQKIIIKHPLPGICSFFLLLLLSSGLWAQTVIPQQCTESPSWIARWTIPSIIAPGATGKVNVVNLVGDGNKTNYYQPPVGSPYTFDVNFSTVREFTGFKIYTPSVINAPANYEVFVRSDSTLPYVSVKKGTIIPVSGQDYFVHFNGSYYSAINVRIVFTDAWATATTTSPLTPLKIYELNFFQCGVDPLTETPVPQTIVPAPTLSCADAVSGNISGIINTYFPGLSNAAAGSKKLDIDVANAQGLPVHKLVTGDRVLIIQMQNALICDSNSMAYGDGKGNDLIASGWLNVQNTGEYEFGIVESISGNTIQLTQPLQKSYDANGVYQVVYSPVYDNVKITGLITAEPWNGFCGGIVTFDAKTLNFNNQTIDVTGLGFRNGRKNSNYDQQPISYYWGTYCTDNDLFFGEKGEGIAGAPRGSYSNLSRRLYNNAVPQLNMGGSYGRGAPGNAGGGGNDHNSGGGGGANIGSGGQGGASYGATASLASPGDMMNYWSNITPPVFTQNGNGFFPNGGMGGKGCVNPDPFRIWLGGAGGGGHQNNNAATGGANGGGIILITARIVKDNGNLIANGKNADHTINTNGIQGNDGAGGGGAGGTIVFGFEDQSAATITYSAVGGSGGDNVFTGDPHGTGGGGGGGAIIVSEVSSNMAVKGGKNGIHVVTNSPWGARSGLEGKVLTTDQLKALYTYSCDHGDAPLSYGDAADQLKPDMPSLKTPGDAEPIALNQPPHDKDALGDDLSGSTNDEDGIYLPFDTLSTAQSYYKVKINVSNTNKVPVIVSGWIDFNGNGIFDDKERITLSGVINGDTTLIWKSFPADITGGDSYARFRVSTGNQAMLPIGVAPDGETEDYTIYINAQPHALPDTTCTHQDRTVKIPVVANDKIQGDKHGKITIKIPPLNGTAVTSDNATPNDKTDDYITYTPKPGYQGDDTLTYELWNAIGNSESAKVTITVKEPVIIDFSALPDEGCSPLDVRFSNLSTDKRANFTWDFGDGSPVSHDFEPAHTFKTVDKTTVFNVKLEMNTGCGIFDTTKQVTVHALPHAVISEKSNEERPEIVVFTDVSSDVASRSWTVDGIIVGSEKQVTAKFDSVGPHVISLRVFNEFGCSDDTTIVHNTVFKGLYVPNAFIPESLDPLVNTFKPVGWGLKEYTLMIFDLWGNLIWKDSQLNKNGQPLNGWNGKDKNGKPLPTDAYIWRISAVLEGGKPWKGMKMPGGNYSTQGTVTIIR